MIGLLQKDFIAMKGKITCIALGVQFLLVILLGVFGKKDFMMDVLYLMLYLNIVMIAFGYPLFFLSTSLFKHERNGKVKRYLLSLPISKREYVREKYIFALVFVYAVLSVLCFEGFVFRFFCANELIPVLQSILPSFAGIVLFSLGIDFAFTFRFGAAGGEHIRTGIVVVLFVIAAVYMMFGNLEIFDKWNIMDLLLYIQEHLWANIVFSMVPILLGGGMFFLSYLIAASSFEKREDTADES